MPRVTVDRRGEPGSAARSYRQLRSPDGRFTSAIRREAAVNYLAGKQGHKRDAAAPENCPGRYF
jgi:hypothetical protein